MSYILDALRRAEAERGRGTVPGIHTPAMPVPGAAPLAGRPAVTPVRLAVAGVAVAALAVVATWWALQRNAPVGVGAGVAAAPAAPAPSAPSSAAAPLAPLAPLSAPAVVAQAAPVQAVVLPAPEALAAPAAPEAPARAAKPAPAPRPAEKRAAAPQREQPAPAPLPASPRAQERAQAPVRAPAAAPMGTVFAQADLPEAVRAQLPSLKISGVTYSSNPAYRMAIVNGQVLHEGDPAAPGLLLEKIEPTRTIWSFQGYRYGLASQ